jgi:hypothetical protein
LTNTLAYLSGAQVTVAKKFDVTDNRKTGTGTTSMESTGLKPEFFGAWTFRLLAILSTIKFHFQ